MLPPRIETRGTIRALGLTSLLLAGAVGPAISQEAGITCPAAAGELVEAGWQRYRDGELPPAERHFRAALDRCPQHVEANIGLGYIAQRSDRDREARFHFEAALTRDPRAVDALVGLGILAWREGALDEVRNHFTRVQELDPSRPEPGLYLSRLPGVLGPEPSRPALVRTDTTSYPARVRGGGFQIRTPQGWGDFYVKGVNLGAALPGKHPSEFPDEDTYRRWIEEMVEMGANTVRVYTVHPPHFYQALRSHNEAHPDRPLWLIQGVWAELPPGSDYEDPDWEREYFSDMHAVVDLLHGQASLPPRPGHAFGHYTADVSSWVLAYILGREWEAHSVAEYNALPGKRTAWRGKYLISAAGTPMDAWLAKACEEIIAFEMHKYGAQRPIAYTNWPTTDPLVHPTESTIAEEAGIRAALGDELAIRPVLDGDDAVGVDPNLVQATNVFPAGYFASYHVYPYFPDFMVLDPELNATRSPFGQSNYYGYLLRLKEHHSGMPLVISEYGVPASLGTAHLHPQGWHHGGHTEAEMAAIGVRMTREIAAAGMAGGVVFSWIDEWFKKTWNTAEFEVPLDRNRLWYNRMDPEEHYGILAMEPEPAIAGQTMAERIANWREVRPLYADPQGASLRVASDEAYLTVFVNFGTTPPPAEFLVGFDTVDPAAGDVRWPGGTGKRLPVGVEFVLRVRPDEVRLVADSHSNPVRLAAFGRTIRGAPLGFPNFEKSPSGLFRGRYQRELNLPLATRPNDDGKYDSLRVLTSRVRFGRDTTEYAATGYDWGVLREGNLPDGAWERSPDGRFLEVRIPWMLLNVSDPSGRRVLHHERGQTAEMGELDTRAIDAIRIVAAGVDSVGEASWTWPGSGRIEDVANYAWQGWEVPRWRSRRRPLFEGLKSAFAEIETATLLVETQNDE